MDTTKMGADPTDLSRQHVRFTGAIARFRESSQKLSLFLPILQDKTAIKPVIQNSRIMKFCTFVFIAFLLPNLVVAQQKLRVHVVDMGNRTPLIGATIVLQGTDNGALTDENGLAVFHQLPNGKLTLECSYVGYETKVLEVVIPYTLAQPMEVELAETSTEMEQVIVSSTRTNSRIEDLPMKVEVLGLEELDEEASLVPSGMGSLLGDLAVITIQRTNPVNGNDAVRMQGLDAAYTQLRQDGMPLYGGFSGSLDVLAIPPLDLRQVEIIKGSASTLFGGGAIGGMVNFITRRPEAKPKTTFVINQTTLGELDVNGFASRRLGKNGFTLLASGTRKQARDINDDNFAEVPQAQRWLIHPRFFWNLDGNTKADLGITYSENHIQSGDIDAIINDSSFTPARFYQREKARRLTLAGQLQSNLNKYWALSIKGTGSLFSRGGDYPYNDFSGRQINSFYEANMLRKRGNHAIVIGTNFMGENYRFLGDDYEQLENHDYTTIGLFAQDNWQITQKLAVETGLRADHHNRFGNFLLPRIGFFYKPEKSISIRLAYGTGYKVPDILEVLQPHELRVTTGMAYNIKADRSQGVNMDINWHKLLWGKLGVEVNQAFYYTHLNKPFELKRYDVFESSYVYQNAPYHIRSLGSDTYVTLHYDAWELYLGYNHTLAQRIDKSSGDKSPVPLNPQDKIAATLAYELGEHWRMGVEAARTANQYVDEGRKVPNYWFVAAMVQWKFSKGSLVLNCENLTDARQSKHEALVTGTRTFPVFTPIWGPVEGRVLNLALKLSF
ncbi:MAG: TonB-dependent receptor [Saprospiraceae bacterium]|nr:TonB-dependent receptor [Saprospiraceae bacterium]